jgi:hypothetical protein
MSVVRVQLLREHLAISRIKHEDQILAQPTLKDAHVYCVLNRISAQQFGPLLERYIRTRFNYTKNSANECTGDCAKDGKNSEVKVSLGGSTHTKFNFVQLRPSHDCDTYILTAYHLTTENVEAEGELYVFCVPKTNIIDLIVKHGSYAHGTFKEHGPITAESIQCPKNTKEYALRPTFNDGCWQSLLPFRIPESAL